MFILWEYVRLYRVIHCRVFVNPGFSVHSSTILIASYTSKLYYYSYRLPALVTYCHIPSRPPWW